MSEERFVKEDMVNRRYSLNEEHEIVDEKGVIPPIKLDFATDDGSEPYRCDTSTLLHHLNRQEILINHKARHIDALTKAFNDERDKADGELREALNRIGNIELEI
ncbi:MAG: hypothetical protein IKF11_09735 [Methanobrevibacter sp.]|nr:hypothetical protein [Methanobrevibacter sp.]